MAEIRLTRRAMAFVLAGGRGSRLKELTDRRVKPAVYFGGKTRIIDFALSNAMNSGIRKMAVATQYKAHSLIRHVQRGWNFFRAERNEFMDILPASQRMSEEHWYRGTADAVTQNIDIVDSYDVDYIIILAGDHIYKMDYEVMLREHVKNDADVTVGCLTVPRADATAFGVMAVDDTGRITSFLEKPADPPGMPDAPDSALASMGIYVFSWPFLRDLLARDAEDPNSSHDFGHDLIPAIVKNGKAMAHRFDVSCVRDPGAPAYWKDVGTVDAFWQANIDLTDFTPELNLWDKEWPIWTYSESVPPAKFIHDEKDRRGIAVSSMVSGGCIISGTEIRNSLLFTQVHTNSYAQLDHVVALPYVTVHRRARLTRAVIDRGVVIPEGLVVGEDPAEDAKWFRVSEGGITLITQDMLDRRAAGLLMRVLSIASECAPLVKTGGLADVAGALPAALRVEGVEMRTLLPGYPAVTAALEDGAEVATFDDLFGAPARVLAGTAAGLDLLVIEAPHLFARPGNPYLGPDGRDWPDNPERFAALSWVGAWIGVHGAGGWHPQVLHGHDWQAGFVTEYLRQMGGGPATVLTIHNIAFTGATDAGRMHGLRLDPGRFHVDGYEYWGGISALKAGLMGADALTTVSPTYAAELMTPEYGMGLEGVIRHRREVLVGILNGIDTDAWNPATDTAIRPFADPAGKATNTAALRAEMGLPDADGPLCVIVSRMTHQKGLDLVLEALPALLDGGGQLALLGSGDPALEYAFRTLGEQNPHVAVRIGYDEAMSHRLIAGGDAILVPSRFEPCGLTQMYGLRYGTVPVVGLTGGLADTVINASPAALARNVATGIQFSPVTADALRGALGRLCRLYRDKAAWSGLVANAMAQPVGWDQSARAYAALYDRLAAG